MEDFKNWDQLEVRQVSEDVGHLQTQLIHCLRHSKQYEADMILVNKIGIMRAQQVMIRNKIRLHLHAAVAERISKLPKETSKIKNIRSLLYAEIEQETTLGELDYTLERIKIVLNSKDKPLMKDKFIKFLEDGRESRAIVNSLKPLKADNKLSCHTFEFQEMMSEDASLSLITDEFIKSTIQGYITDMFRMKVAKGSGGSATEDLKHQYFMLFNKLQGLINSMHDWGVERKYEDVEQPELSQIIDNVEIFQNHVVHYHLDPKENENDPNLDVNALKTQHINLHDKICLLLHATADERTWNLSQELDLGRLKKIKIMLYSKENPDQNRLVEFFTDDGEVKFQVNWHTLLRANDKFFSQAFGHQVMHGNGTHKTDMNNVLQPKETALSADDGPFKEVFEKRQYASAQINLPELGWWSLLVDDTLLKTMFETLFQFKAKTLTSNEKSIRENELWEVVAFFISPERMTYIALKERGDDDDKCMEIVMGDKFVGIICKVVMELNNHVNVAIGKCGNNKIRVASMQPSIFYKELIMRLSNPGCNMVVNNISDSNQTSVGKYIENKMVVVGTWNNLTTIGLLVGSEKMVAIESSYFCPTNKVDESDAVIAFDDIVTAAGLLNSPNEVVKPHGHNKLVGSAVQWQHCSENRSDMLPPLWVIPFSANEAVQQGKSIKINSCGLHGEMLVLIDLCSTQEQIISKKHRTALTELTKEEFRKNPNLRGSRAFPPSINLSCFLVMLMTTLIFYLLFGHVDSQISTNAVFRLEMGSVRGEYSIDAFRDVVDERMLMTEKIGQDCLNTLAREVHIKNFANDERADNGLISDMAHESHWHFIEANNYGCSMENIEAGNVLGMEKNGSAVSTESIALNIGDQAFSCVGLSWIDSLEEALQEQADIQGPLGKCGDMIKLDVYEHSSCYKLLGVFKSGTSGISLENETDDNYPSRVTHDYIYVGPEEEDHSNNSVVVFHCVMVLLYIFGFASLNISSRNIFAYRQSLPDLSAAGVLPRIHPLLLFFFLCSLSKVAGMETISHDESSGGNILNKGTSTHKMKLSEHKHQLPSRGMSFDNENAGTQWEKHRSVAGEEIDANQSKLGIVQRNKGIRHNMGSHTQTLRFEVGNDESDPSSNKIRGIETELQGTDSLKSSPTKVVGDHGFESSANSDKNKNGSTSSSGTEHKTDVTIANKYTLGEAMNRLKKLRHGSLRGSHDVDSPHIIEEMRDIVDKHLDELLSVQKYLKDGDDERAAFALKSIVGDIDRASFIGPGKEIKSMNKLEIDGKSLNIGDIPNSQLIQFVQPNVFDDVIAHLQHFRDVLQGIDTSLFSRFQKSRQSKTGQFRRNHEVFSFEFGTSPFEFAADGGLSPNQHSFNAHNKPSMKNLLRHYKSSMRKGFSSLSNLGKVANKFHKNTIIMSKHQSRLGALGGTCDPVCAREDLLCNCEKLLECVQDMTSYDLAILVAGGYIDGEPTSESYGNFTLSVNELNLYDADQGANSKLVAIQQNIAHELAHAAMVGSVYGKTKGGLYETHPFRCCRDSGYYFLACGGGTRNNAACFEKEESAFATEKHALRCCSNLKLDYTWTRLNTCPRGVWGKSLMNGKCYDAVNFDEADNICENAGGRLCTKEEIDSDCARGTGCLFDEKMVWTSDKNPEWQISSPITCPDNLHVQQFSFTSDKTFNDAQMTCENDGGRLCTKEEIESGCALTTNWIEYKIQCGGSQDDLDSRCSETPYMFAAVNEKHALKCCLDSYYPIGSYDDNSWQRCGARYQNSTINENCYDAVDYYEGKNICESVGGRLCTSAEIAGCSSNECGFNHDMIWTSEFINFAFKDPNLENLWTPTLVMDKDTCNDVLSQLFSACHPSDMTCLNPNLQSYAVSTDQVCDAVNTPQKLLFEAIGDEFDGFNEKFTDAPCKPLSYDTCAEFVTEFDRLYQGRDKDVFPLNNPMLRDPKTTTVFDKTDNQVVFRLVRFPVRYNFEQDISTGVVHREFGSDVDADENQYFYLVNPSSGKVLGFKDGLCSDSTTAIEVQDRIRQSNDQQFHLTPDGRLENKLCSGTYLTYGISSIECMNDGPLVSWEDADEPDLQRWTFHSDGSIVNKHCGQWEGNLAISIIQDDTINDILNVEDIPVQLISPEANKIMGLGSGNCWSILRKFTLQDIKEDEDDQIFYFERTMNGNLAITNSACVGVGNDSRAHPFISDVQLYAYFDHCGPQSGVFYSAGFCNGDDCDVDFADLAGNDGGACADSHGGLAYSYVSKTSNELYTEDLCFDFCKSLPGFENQVGLERQVSNQNYCACLYQTSELPSSDDLPSDVSKLSSDGNGPVLYGNNDNTRMCFPFMNKQEWKINSDQTIESVKCEGMVLTVDGGDLVINYKKEFGWNQCWSIKSNTARVMTSTGNSGQEWKASYVKPNYDYALQYGFPGEYPECHWTDNDCSEDCLDSIFDKRLALSVMHNCDESMSLLLGWTTSVGTLRAVASLVNEKGPAYMPGMCCMDVATNSEFFGYRYDPTFEYSDGTKMSCQHRGPWHLGISVEACETAGGEWYRSPCVTLQDCIGDRPTRHNLETPIAGTCQNALKKMNTGFVSISTTHANFTFDATKMGCFQFCQSLTHYSLQIGMEIEGYAYDASACTCLYNSEQVPSREFLPEHIKDAALSLPKFSLKDASGKLALGLRYKSDCTADEISVELQKYRGSHRQEFQLTYDGNIVSVLCPTRVLTANEDCLVAMAPYFNKVDDSLQQKQVWDLNDDGSITNVAVPEQRVSAMYNLDSRLVSFYFGLESSRTHLMMGVVGSEDECFDGTRIEMQERTYGSPNQKFFKTTSGSSHIALYSVVCPELGISIPDGGCESGIELHLSSKGSLWQFHSNSNTIESEECPGMFIDIDNGALNSGRNTQSPPDLLSTFKFRNRVSKPTEKSSRALQEADAPAFSSDEDINKTEHAPTHRTNFTSPQQYMLSEISSPTVGSAIALSNRTSQQYQIWTMKYRPFSKLLGPFSFINPANRLAFGVEQGSCLPNMLLKLQSYDYNSLNQKFYLGKHGSIFSSKCPGLVIAMENQTDGGCRSGQGETLRLRPYVSKDIHMKWKVNDDGSIESANCLGVVISIGEDSVSNLTLHHRDSDSYSQVWRRLNVRLLSTESFTHDVDWIQHWTIDFTELGYNSTDIQKFSQSGGNVVKDSICYPSNDAFNRAFDEFAREVVIQDAADEDQCQTAREHMGFESDHIFDTEVCQQFQHFMCDPFFTGLDHLTEGAGVINEDGVTSIPVFTMVEYEEVEYDEVEYMEVEDYEEVQYETVEYDFEGYEEDSSLIMESVNKDNVAVSDAVVLENQAALLEMQQMWLQLEEELMHAEQTYEIGARNAELVCEGLPKDLLIVALGAGTAVPNPFLLACITLQLGVINGLHVNFWCADIAFNSINYEYEMETEGPDARLESQFRIESTYNDLRSHIIWNRDALDIINTNMESQHTAIRHSLQDRHEDMERNIGEDINEARNALGQAIVDTQNALGQALVDSQNANGQLIVDAQNSVGQYVVDAQNANGQAIVDARNAVSDQHNQMLEWLYTNLCTINQLSGGTCEQFIGPLEEGHAHIPLQLHWPEGQVTLVDAIESKMKVVEGKIDAFEEKVLSMNVMMMHLVRQNKKLIQLMEHKATGEIFLTEDMD